MSFVRYLKSLRICAVHCFNANQVTNHQHEWLVAAIKEEQEAWYGMPKWMRKILNKYTLE